VPGGSSVVAQTITNPLLSFQFPSGASSQFGQVVDSGLSTSRTVRCSASAAASSLSGDNLKDQVYSAFTRSTTFSRVSAGTPDTVMPFEQPHNAVHVDAACGNHFSSVGNAGFDPLFMLHHANIDRLWAIWQEIYSVSIPSGSTTGGSWSINQGSSFTASTGLSPFYRTSSTRWTTSNLLQTSALGYTYTGIDLSASAATRRANANTIVNQLYSPTGSGSGGGGSGPVNPRRPTNPRRGNKKRADEDATDKTATDKPATDKPAADKPKADDTKTDKPKTDPSVKADPTGNATVPSSSDLSNAVPRRFFAKITVDTNKLPTLPISLKFYIEGDLAGSFTLLHAPQDTIAKGEVPLHRVLSETGYQDKFTDDEMEDKIEEALQVVFLRPDDTTIDPESVAGAYTVDVESAELIPNKKIDQLPGYGKSSRRRITPGLIGGRFPPIKGLGGKKPARRSA